MFLKLQILKSEWFLKDHVMLETGVMTTENSERFIFNKLHYKTYSNNKYCNIISTLLGYLFLLYYCYYCICDYMYNSLGVHEKVILKT